MSEVHIISLYSLKRKYLNVCFLDTLIKSISLKVSMQRNCFFLNVFAVVVHICNFLETVVLSYSY